MYSTDFIEKKRVYIQLIFNALCNLLDFMDDMSNPYIEQVSPPVFQGKY